MLIVVGLSAAWAADCDKLLSTAELDGLLGEARRSLEKLDAVSFVDATNEIDLAIPCLGEPLTPHLAAEIHRTKGIRAVSERDPEAPRIFAAARAIEPAYKFPSTLIPEGNPVRLAYAEFDLSTGQVAPLPSASEGTLTLDGRHNNWRPIDWPTVAQYLGPDGSVVWTTYLHPGIAMPAYPAQAEVPQTAVNPLLIGTATEPVVKERKSPKVPLGVAAIVSGVLTGTFYAAAGVAESQFKDPTTPDDDLEMLRSRANTLSIVSAFTGAATVGFGVGFVVAK